MCCIQTVKQLIIYVAILRSNIILFFILAHKYLLTIRILVTNKKCLVKKVEDFMKIGIFDFFTL
jgi:hypothetical protein